MRKLCFLLLIAWVTVVLSGTLQAGSVEITGTQGKCTDGRTPDDVITEARIGTRSGTFPDAKKTWLQFDLSGLYAENPGLQGNITNAKLVFYGAKDETGNKDYVVSGLNDAAVLEAWDATALTWNNAPGNDTATGNSLLAGVTTALYTGTVLPPCLDTLTETPAADQPALTAFLNTDTDGKVTFIFTAGSTTYLWNVGSPLEPVLVIEGDLTGAQCEGVGVPYSMYAVQSCRTELFDGTNPRVNDNRTDSNKLSVRSDNKAAKSWIKFDLSELNLDPNNLKVATLRITLYEPKTNTCFLSAVNDNCLDNINWTETTLTWNNAPGNITSSDGINPDDTVTYTVDDLQDNLNPAKTTVVSTVDYSYGGLAGDQFFFDVLPILQADSDGIVQFALHSAGGSTNFATHDTSAGAEYWPRLDLLAAPAGADNPSPCPGGIVSTDLANLSWTNPDPNDGTSPITCTVYLGTEPNRPQMDSVTLSPDAFAVLINTTNFSNHGNLQNLTTYYWTVDCDDPSAGLIPGLMWDFLVNNNEPPVVNAGPDQAVWLGKSGTPGQEVVSLDGTTSDDGLPNPPGTYTVQWTQVANSAPTVIPSPNNTEDASVTLTARGDYEFMLTADDGQAQTSDTVRIVVGDDPCDASHIKTPAQDYDPGDYNEDCIVNLQDFAMLIVANWLDCTDTLMNCGN